MTPIRFWQVDAFTSRPFGGNSAAVCWLEQDAPEAWMQAVAAEMNLSETAFVQRGDDGYGLRWFTPRIEVPLCGHATLG
ncbi:PhzF family phenazine biosynthesis protein, partial [Blastopirellula marina]|uniref:PhzF family phenazine biosynthesis protein n=1 Tax=Blastopirellula marina TaxID=124 RepID=UPI00058BD048